MAAKGFTAMPPDFHSAFTRLEATVSPEHARLFQSTTIHDVWVSIKEMETRMAARQSSRGLRRVEPLLRGIEQYSEVVGVLCNGTPYLPWLWVWQTVYRLMSPRSHL